MDFHAYPMMTAKFPKAFCIWVPLKQIPPHTVQDELRQPVNFFTTRWTISPVTATILMPWWLSLPMETFISTIHIGKKRLHLWVKASWCGIWPAIACLCVRVHVRAFTFLKKTKKFLKIIEKVPFFIMYIRNSCKVHLVVLF